MGVLRAAVKPGRGLEAREVERERAGNNPVGTVRMLDYLPRMLSVSVGCFVALLVVGCAILAAWILTRFRGIGPRTLVGALVASGAAMILVSALPSFIDGVTAAGLPDVRFVIAFGLTLPVFTYFFLAAGWFLRSLVALLDGLR
jgi:hypothetical protein